MKQYFYDVEALENVFSICNFRQEENVLDVFVLSDDPKLLDSPTLLQDIKEVIYKRNKNFKGEVLFYNLANDNDIRIFTKLIGLSDAYLVNDPNSKSNYPKEFRPVCDTDENYNENIHPYLFGYNSYNYDTTILAKYLDLVWSKTPEYEVGVTERKHDGIPNSVTAREMRAINDMLFTKNFKSQMPKLLTYEISYKGPDMDNQSYQTPAWRIRKNMLMTGRHIDIARLNEKQSKVGLKRLLGMLGYQILESKNLRNKTKLNTKEELYELIAYNVSDVVNLAELFKHKFYQGQFTLKKGLLKTYPELIYDRAYDKNNKPLYEPDIKQSKVRRDRLTIDSSSAQFAAKALCPYDHLTDIETVSFKYPSDRIVEEYRRKGIPIKQINVLNDARDFFYKNFPQKKLREEFDIIYRYYKSIEGKNFNNSKYYKEDYPNGLMAESLSSIQKVANNLFYYNADGTPSSCFVTFSTGGIHGAEYNKMLYDAHMEIWEREYEKLEYVKRMYPNPCDLRKAKEITFPDGTTEKYSKFLKSTATIKKMEAAKPEEYASFYKVIESPKLFKPKDDGSTELNSAYVYTSAGIMNHEDFVSYYPNLLRKMSAFWNEGLGVDRYGQLFDDKERYGKLRKDKSLTQEERDMYDILREGTKLILNAASGGADTDFDLPIQMNNQIISMRIIGQLYTWRIGQAQTLKGAIVPSTNTDGLFTIMEESRNNEILAKESADIYIEIEPEITYLISKDSNNRLEVNPKTGHIDAAGGGTLGCRTGPTPTKALSHPAIIDWALAEYLVYASTGNKGLSLDKPFNDEIGMNILKESFNTFSNKQELLKMYQNVVASSNASMSYVFASHRFGDEIIERALQHYNRVFIMKDNTPDTVNLYIATARKISNATFEKRKRLNERPIQHVRNALAILNANGVTSSDLPSESEAIVKKVTNIEPEWSMRIENASLYDLTDEEINTIVENLDLGKYLSLLNTTYTNNWMNKLPEAA